MRNLTGDSATAEQTEAEWTQRLQERSDPGRGLGYWIGWHDGAFAGWWGIGACSWDQSTANLGYRLTPSSWGMGLATLGSQAFLTHAFETVGLASVWASTTQSNLASRRVLTKLWMRYPGFEHEQCHYTDHRRGLGGSDPTLTRDASAPSHWELGSRRKGASYRRLSARSNHRICRVISLRVLRRPSTTGLPATTGTAHLADVRSCRCAPTAGDQRSRSRGRSARRCSGSPRPPASRGQRRWTAAGGRRRLVLRPRAGDHGQEQADGRPHGRRRH